MQERCCTSFGEQQPFGDMQRIALDISMTQYTTPMTTFFPLAKLSPRVAYSTRYTVGGMVYYIIR